MAFGLTPEQILGQPPAASSVPRLLAQPQAAPAAPFIWGAGGAALTPDDIARRRQMAEAEIAAGMDYSPVGHWTQGLARTLQGVVGGLEERKLDKAAAANAEYDRSVAAALIGGGSSGALAALADPRLSEGTRSVAELLYKQNNPAPRAPGADEELLLAQGLVPGTPQYQAAAKALFDRKSDPIVTVSTPIGIYSGPQSQLGQFMGGGGQPSAGSPGTVPSPPATLPPDFDFGEPATPTTAAPMLRGAASSTVISPSDASRIRASLGPKGRAAFEQWMARHNVKIGAQ